MDMIPLSTYSGYYTATTTNFSFSLFRELSSSVEGNVFASTYNVNLLLLLLAIGSKNNTFFELTNVLSMSNHKPPPYDKIKQINENIQDEKYLNVANGIFTDQKFDLNVNYVNMARDTLNSEVRKFDFANNPSDGEQEINEWTRNNTRGKISKLYEPGDITRDTLLILASTVHFQDVWKNRFRETKKSKFCLSPTEHIDITLMHQTEYYNYYKDNVNKFAALEIPYRSGKYEMVILLPDRMDGVKSLEHSFLSEPTKFQTLLANMTIHKVILDIPKFKIESNFNLEYALKNMGCREMFSPNADFSRMYSSKSRNQIAVDNIKHKTVVTVDEKGTEAAAIAGADVTLLSYQSTPEAKTVNFHACHPFLFIIKKGNNIIFMGRLSNPFV